MKRFFKILGLIILLLLGAGIALPWVFEDEIVRRAKTEINNNLEAEVAFEDVSLRLLRTFPEFGLQVEDFSISGKDHFAGVELARIGRFELELNIWSVLTGSPFSVKQITMRDVDIHILIDKQGRANYDIVTSGPEEGAEPSAGNDSTSTFQLALKGYRLENVDLLYEDLPGEIYTRIEGLSHMGRGDLTEAVSKLETHTQVNALTVGYGGIHYMEQVKLDSDLDLTYYSDSSRIELGDNDFSLNELALKFTGEVKMPGDDIAMNLQVSGVENNFKSALSLVPSIYSRDFAQLEAQGEFSLDAEVKGVYGTEPERYPSFDVKVIAREGQFAYPSLPTRLENFSLNLRVYNPTDQLEGTAVDIQNFYLKAGRSQLSGSLQLADMLEDPRFGADLEGKVFLEDFNTLLPNPDYHYSGTIKAGLQTRGLMSDVNQERYEAVKMKGSLELDSVRLQSNAVPYPIAVPRGRLTFSPQAARLESLELKLGKSDLAANGTVDNLLNYALQEELLRGRFALSSSFLDLNELSSSVESDTDLQNTSPDTAALEIIRLPENVDFKLDATVREIEYADLDLSNIQGSLQLVGGAAQMNNLRMDLLGGSMSLGGTYQSIPEKPRVDLDLKIRNFGFGESYQKLSAVQKLAPIAREIAGNYSLGMSFSSDLQGDMSPDMASVKGKGSLQTTRITVGGKVLKTLANSLKNPNLATLGVSPLNMDFAVENGRLEVEPFDLRAGRIRSTVSGSSGLDGSLDYHLETELPVQNIQAQNLLKKLGASSGQQVNLTIEVGGTTEKPQIRTDLGNQVGQALDQVKKQVKEKVDQVVDDTKEKARAQAQKLIKNAEEKGDKLIAEAEKKADAIRAEGQKQGAKIRREADAQAQKILDKAGSNPLKKAAAKKSAETIRQEADKRAAQVEQKADQEAQQLIDQAKKQKQKLINEARSQANSDS